MYRINLKLKDGGQNLSSEERDQLIQRVLELKMVLSKNEELFYKNNIFYKNQVDLLQSQIADVYDLEDKLFKSELLGKNFKEILIVTFIALFGLVVITFLLKFIISTLKEQKNKLALANSEIEKINANLEDIVSEKTKSLKLRCAPNMTTSSRRPGSAPGISAMTL